MTIPSLRPLVAVLALVVASALGTTAAVGAAPLAHAARARAHPRSCDVSSVADELGPTSVTSLTVTGVSCDTGKAVVKAFHRCRLAHGTQGRCVRLVMGYACGEIRTDSPTQFSSTATCRKGRKTVVHRYTQVI